MPDDSDLQRRRQQAAAQARARVEALKATAEELEADPIPVLTLTEQRVEMIIDAMTSGTWVAVQSARQLAKDWGLSIVRVEGIAAEASRHVRRLLRDSPEAQRDALNEALMSFDRIAKKAEAIGTPNGFRVAKDTRVDKLTFMGLKPATKHIIRKDEMSDWTDAELEHFAATGDRPLGKQ